MTLLSRLTTILKPRVAFINYARSYAFFNFTPKRQVENVFKNSQGFRRGISFRVFPKQTVEKLKIKDNVPDQYELIYRNKMDTYLLFAQIFSTVFASVVIVVLLIKQDVESMKLHTESWRARPGAVEHEALVYIAMFVVVCTLLQLLISKMPLRIYNYPKQKDYIAVLYGNFPGSKKKIVYKLKEVSKVEESGVLPWRDSWYKVENHGKMILLEEAFRTPADLNIMLGYQKDEEEDD